MDKLAAALGIDPVELRIANAMRPGTRMPTGQVVPEPAPVAELLERVRAMPLPPAPVEGDRDLRELPGGVSNTTHGEGVRRGVGYAVGIKNVGFSEGFDDYSTARVRLFDRRRGAAGGGPHGGRRGRPGPRHRAGADRPHRAGRRARRRADGRHAGGLGRVELGLAPDVRDRRRGQGRLRGDPRASRRRSADDDGGRAGRAARRGRDRGDGRVASPRDLSARRERPGRRSPPVRILGPPGGRRRRSRAWPGPGRRARDGAGGRQGDEPPGARGPDPGWDRPGSRPGPARGDPGQGRQGAERVVHRLPAADDPRHAADADRDPRARRPGGAVRAQGRGGAAAHLDPARGRRRAARRQRSAAHAGPGPSGAHRRPRTRGGASVPGRPRRAVRALAVGRRGGVAPAAVCQRRPSSRPRSRRRCARRPASASSS